MTVPSTAEIANREDAPDVSSKKSTSPVVAAEAIQDGKAKPPNVNEAATAPPIDSPAPTDTTSEAEKNTESSGLQEETSIPSPPPDNDASPQEVADIQVAETEFHVSFEQPLDSAGVLSPTPLDSQEAENPEVVKAEKPSDSSTSPKNFPPS